MPFAQPPLWRRGVVAVLFPGDFMNLNHPSLYGRLLPITCWRYAYGIDRLSQVPLYGNVSVSPRQRPTPFYGTDRQRAGAWGATARRTRTGLEPADHPQRPARV